MSTNAQAASPASVTATSAASTPQPSGGLYLTGMVVAVKSEDKEWEGKKYTQKTVSVSDGEQVFLWSWRDGDIDAPLTLPPVFKEVKIRVKRATTEKGQIRVSGVVIR